MCHSVWYPAGDDLAAKKTILSCESPEDRVVCLWQMPQSAPLGKIAALKTGLSGISEAVLWHIAWRQASFSLRPISVAEGGTQTEWTHRPEECVRMEGILRAYLRAIGRTLSQWWFGPFVCLPHTLSADTMRKHKAVISSSKVTSACDEFVCACDSRLPHNALHSSSNYTWKWTFGIATYIGLYSGCAVCHIIGVSPSSWTQCWFCLYVCLVHCWCTWHYNVNIL